MQRIGFRDVAITPFEEMPGALAASARTWRFPWTVVAGSKPSS
jgi:hypothetical protein